MLTPSITAMATPKSDTLMRLKSFTNFIGSPIDTEPKSAATATTTTAKKRIE
jgi:hypothetical protein